MYLLYEIIFNDMLIKKFYVPSFNIY
jgi:hypothetical protein